MPVLNRISYFQDRRDEALNVALAKELAAKKDKNGIREIADELWNKNTNIANDCIKVLYEVGAIDPVLIADYASEFLKLLQSKNNRMAWGAMTALAVIAELKADVIYKQLSAVQEAMTNGSVITMDNGVKVLALVAASSKAHSAKVFPFLLTHLATCRPKDVPQHSEKTLVAVTARNQEAFVDVLKKRLPKLSVSQTTRVKKVIKEAQAKP
jgi:hypothetical protein